MGMGLGMGMSSLSPATSGALPQSQGWQLTVLDKGHTTEEKLEIEGEIERLDMVLASEVGEWENRLADINEELKGKK